MRTEPLVENPEKIASALATELRLCESAAWHPEEARNYARAAQLAREILQILAGAGEAPVACPDSSPGVAHAAETDSPAPRLPDPTLDAFAQTLREYQLACVEDALDVIEASWAGNPERKRLYSLPTGTGKGSIELALLQLLVAQGVNAWCLTPSLEVLRGYLERCGVTAEQLESASGEQLAEWGEAIRVTTPVRMQNRILDGSRQTPEVVLYDEVHHATESNDVSGLLFAVAPAAVWFGFTATPYRGTPKATLELRKTWGEPHVVLSMREAADLGHLVVPRFSIKPLVDDDEVKVAANGEFVVKASSEAVLSRIADLAALTASFWGDPGGLETGLPRFDVPTVVVVPNTDVARELVAHLDKLGVPASYVAAETGTKDRAAAFARCRDRRLALISIKVLGEGVDFPWLGRIIDVRPTQSAVQFVQLVGRLMRPKPDGSRPEYICCCRNLERHAYLLQGAVPREVVAEAQAAFLKPSKRLGTRAVGLEALKRFKAIELPLYGGAKGHMHALYSVDENGVQTEFVALSDPTQDRPLCAVRTNTPLPLEQQTEKRKHDYGKWRTVAELPTEFKGYQTSRWTGPLTPSQRKWWEAEHKNGAAAKGLDVGAQVTQRQFAALPMLCDTGRSLRAQA